MLISSEQETKIHTNQNGLVIEGMYGLTVSFSDITQVDTVSSLPKIGIRTNGYAFGKTKTGNFRLTDGQDVKLYIKNGFPPYIRAQSKLNKPIYINFEDTKRTVDLYNDLVNNKIH